MFCLSSIRKRIEKTVARARQRTHLQAVSKLTEEIGGRRRIASDPPLLVPLRDAPTEFAPEELDEVVEDAYAKYLATLPHHVRALVSRYRIVDTALKVVGVGSVGTRCLIMLLEAGDSKSLTSAGMGLDYTLLGIPIYV